MFPVCRHCHGHAWHVHGCQSSGRHHDKGAHHVVVLMFQQVTMIHEAACEANEGGSDRDKLTGVDAHGVFPAYLVRIERPMSLKEDRWVVPPVSGLKLSYCRGLC